mmetsp:Transcript_22060/g.33953  ORF Transcript_22060/g.33953 Transcript_22060/m.33953 type:complete len:431 (+) Transcript_22060:105-1397(+)|eukprot:CAMPEP_0195287096 /NCGR_PEP_ID=MMETSP0707-20130614/4305_1 /TAXON_ID=33640 /ORGANISM="Asterionellopsis glacialis, Strain CCMP134" /LENGTH=430 /DNA_ID=CAMNT_0040346823 /DNA_START=98 /DNA_END=1390 /DNA_ORIENTATION=+
MVLGIPSGGMPGGPAAMHHDVLQATPDSPEAKARLLEELKNRARSSVQTKNYPAAEVLYTKGLTLTDINADKAVLHANLALVQRNMNQLSDARKNAESAVELDPTYVKGWWRLGQTLSSLHHTKDAFEAFTKAHNLEPSNAALMKECKKLEKKLEEEEKLMKETEEAAALAAAAIEDDKIEPPKVTTIPKKTTTTTTDSSISKSSTTTASTANNDNNDKLFTKSDHVKGYKVVNGKKTSYFHNELTDEAKKLIGDIAPKRLEEAPANAIPKAAPEGASAWNKAGTWEEKDVSAWATDTLKAALLTTAYTLPDGSPDAGAVASIVKVDKCDGHSSFATVRGKKRYIYEFLVKLTWKLELTNGHTCQGTMAFPDIDGTCELGDGYDMVEYSVDEGAPSDARHLLDRFVKNDGLRDALHQTIDDWVRLFRATY